MFQLCFNFNRIHDSVGKALRTANQRLVTVNSRALSSSFVYAWVLFLAETSGVLLTLFSVFSIHPQAQISKYMFCLVSTLKPFNYCAITVFPLVLFQSSLKMPWIVSIKIIFVELISIFWNKAFLSICD
jgi:hypothetical protein